MESTSLLYVYYEVHWPLTIAMYAVVVGVISGIAWMIVRAVRKRTRR